MQSLTDRSSMIKCFYIKCLNVIIVLQAAPEAVNPSLNSMSFLPCVYCLIHTSGERGEKGLVDEYHIQEKRA